MHARPSSWGAGFFTIDWPHPHNHTYPPPTTHPPFLPPPPPNTPHSHSTHICPPCQVEATKFTEVGFHGRDVDQIIRDLVDNAIIMMRQVG